MKVPEAEAVLITEAETASPAAVRAAQCRVAWCSGAKWPFMCTLMTASHCASVILAMKASRRMPALLTRMSRRPYSATAWSISALAPSHVAMLSVLATAVPPAATISAATAAAGPPSVPDPSLATPRSLTTTSAPSFANSSACSRPMPPPAPVMTATRPSSAPMSVLLKNLDQSVGHDDVSVGRGAERVPGDAVCGPGPVEGSDDVLAREHRLGEAHGMASQAGDVSPGEFL